MNVYFQRFKEQLDFLYYEGFVDYISLYDIPRFIFEWEAFLKEYSLFMDC